MVQTGQTARRPGPPKTKSAYAFAPHRVCSEANIIVRRKGFIYMCGNNSCLWIIIILIILFSCGNNCGFGGCGCGCGCNNNCGCNDGCC